MAVFKYNSGVVLLLLVNIATSTDYCDPKVCTVIRGGVEKVLPHVACNHNGNFGEREDCGDNPSLYSLTPEDKEFILDLHNKNRQEIASGKLSKYEPAANMKEVTWNDELAYVASCNAKSCKFAHDQCRNTDAHPNSGQNLAIVAQSRGFKPFREAYKDLHNKWFLEHENCDMATINKFEPRLDSIQIGHFTQMVADNVNQVGCAISMYEKPPMKYVHIVCNYSYVSMKNRPIYIAGRPKCRKYSRKYKSLCAN